MKEYFTQNAMKPMMMTDALNSSIPYLTKLNHDIETNLMSGNTLFVQLIYLTAFMEGQN
jgi:hypothetical protein